MSENGWLLETRRLSKRFGGLVAVDSLGLAIHPGEVRGLIGPNGSGKTTTINLLAGLADRKFKSTFAPPPPAATPHPGLWRAAQRAAAAGAACSKA